MEYIAELFKSILFDVVSFKWCDNVICFQQILDADGKYNTTRES